MSGMKVVKIIITMVIAAAAVYGITSLVGNKDKDPIEQRGSTASVTVKNTKISEQNGKYIYWFEFTNSGSSDVTLKPVIKLFKQGGGIVDKFTIEEFTLSSKSSGTGVIAKSIQTPEAPVNQSGKVDKYSYSLDGSNPSNTNSQPLRLE